MTGSNTAANGRPVTASGTFDIGGDLPVHRLGFGAMRITGPGIWGPPADRDEAIRLLRRAVDLGVDLIDTAEAYGPHVSEELIREALHPYPDELAIATKGGLRRTGPGRGPGSGPDGRPEFLRNGVEGSLRRLGLDTIDVYYLHRVDPRVPLEESLGELKAMQDEGKVRHLGLSEVTVPVIQQAAGIVDVAIVQNRYNLTDRDEHESVVEHCEREQIGFVPFFPLATGTLADSDGPLAAAAARHQATPSQIALAWLLRRSPVILPIPGTSTVAHLEQNCAAAALALTDDEFSDLSATERGATP